MPEGSPRSIERVWQQSIEADGGRLGGAGTRRAAVQIEQVVGLLTALGLIAYLTYTIIRPDRF